MKALYYRYLFENVENGMIQAGSIYNEENDCSVNYVYLSGNPTNSNINDGVSSKDSSRTNDITGIGILDKRTIRRLAGAPIDLVVVGEYTRDCLGILYALLQNTTIQTVIMPYVAPIHRMLVEQWISEEQDMEEKALPEQWILEPEMSPEKLLEFSCLIRHPYHALKNMGGGKCLFIIWKLSALFPRRSAECQKRKLFRTGRCRGFRNDKDYGTGIHSGGQGRMHH